MNKHTAGPWHVVCDTVVSTEQGDPYIVVQTTHGALDIIAPGEMRSEHLANANLIAAAPDLLEALRGLLTHYGVKFSEWMSSNDDGSPKPVTHPLCVAARAAIARAEGRA